MSRHEDYDVIVVGSGFGGSTAALRLREKGYRVAVLESGRRFADDELPRTSWDLRRYLWAPQIGCYGVQRVHLLPGVLVMAGAGVGGGSLNYANTLYRPPSVFFQDPQWAGITDWETELAPYYDQASRMLGVATNPSTTAADVVIKKVAEQMGVAGTFRSTPVGVFFGDPALRQDPALRAVPGRPGPDRPDPFFGGAGPRRTPCTECGGCMTGCRDGGKNTLVKNYLYLAERAGAEVFPLTTAVGLRPGADGGWTVRSVRSGSWFRRGARTWTARQVVLAAGTYGTQRLLHSMKDAGQLPDLSPRLGHLTRTNSEAVLAATSRSRHTDFSRGVAITSSVHLDANTHLEPVRYGPGSNVIGLLQTVLVDGGGPRPRWLTALGIIGRAPVAFLRGLSVRQWSERTLITLVMQSLDNSLIVSGRRGRLRRGLVGAGLTSAPGLGEPIPAWIPKGHEAVRRVAAEIDGDAGGAFTELMNIPMTAHFLGGCTIGSTAADGVIDPYHRVFGYPGLSVVDGSAVSANLGVNPALTITAQAERAFALWPNLGDPDPRPAPGEAYRPLVPVLPHAPAVPSSAPAALRLQPTPRRGKSETLSP